MDHQRPQYAAMLQQHSMDHHTAWCPSCMDHHTAYYGPLCISMDRCPSVWTIILHTMGRCAVTLSTKWDVPQPRLSLQGESRRLARFSYYRGDLKWSRSNLIRRRSCINRAWLNHIGSSRIFKNAPWSDHNS